MHARALQSVLLVRAIEESDRSGDLLPLADREEATRTAARSAPEIRESLTGTTLSRPAERFLAERARLLRERVLARSPILANVLSLAGGSSRMARVVLVVAFAVGVALSALDGSRRINILAFPLIGLVAWNLLVYLVLLFAWLRPRAAKLEAAPGISRLYERWIRWRTEGLLRRSSLFNAPLAASLRRFTADWVSVGQPILVLRAKRLLHLSAVLVAVGLIAGLYVRGVVLRYDAGWESTFLGPSGARILVSSLYAPASSLTGLALPGTDEQMRALEWTASGGGANAALWIHLIAATAALLIIVPRLLAALATTVGLWRVSRRPEIPASVVKYARALLTGSGVVAPQSVSVAPYAFQPAEESLAGLQKLLEAAAEGRVEVEPREPLQYGEEGELSEWLSRDDPRDAQLHVILFTLSATPEAENHGAVITAFREWAPRGSVLVVVDESEYAARIAGDSSLQARLDERRDLWLGFVRRFGVGAIVANLRRLASGATPGPETLEDIRAALGQAPEAAAR
jgi:hypothetical protein